MTKNVDNPFKSPLATISIGPGIRGIERGVERTGARLRVLSYVEIESFIIENLVAQMELGFLDSSLIWSDAKTFPARLFRDIVDLLLAGYSCQPFSNAGKRLGAEDPRHLYPYIERTIDIVRPKIVFFENVRGHITLGLREVIESLERMGYRVHWGIFSAEETGASHKRERVFIMGIRKDCLDNASSNGFTPDNSISARRNSIKSSSQLANSESINRRLQLFKGKSREHIPESIRSSQMANTKSKLCKQSRYSWKRRSGFTKNGESWDNQFERIGTEKEFEPDEQLGNTNNTRLQGRNSEECRKCSYKWITRKNDSFFRGAVARPGQPQHDWESPRTTTGQWETKSGMGGPINGYKFREDFLRALGNSVYEETAELAWETLLNKFQTIK